jgi:hypothetical protein
MERARLEAILEAIFAVEIRQREEEDAGEKGFQYRIVGSIGVYGFIYMGLFTLEDGSPTLCTELVRLTSMRIWHPARFRG